MQTLFSIKSLYEKKSLNKADYIHEMYKYHVLLNEYSNFVKNTDISKIEITEDLVTMTSRMSNICMICNKQDERIVPLEILNFNNYEKNELSLILKMINTKSVVFDIGANTGWYALNIAKHLPKTKIYAFEPIRSTYAFLKRNIKLNNLHNIQTHNFGFSKENKKIDFYYYPEGSGNASLANLTHKRSVKKISCLVKTIDSFVQKNHISIDFIKCDVEGAELFVFQGGLEIIKRDKPIIFSEILRKWTAKFKYNPNDIIQLFHSIGYQCFSIRNKSLKEFQIMNVKTKETNFFFLHTIKHKSLIKQLVN
jgi:FkbM family methyltransferase